jgi:predicted RNA binding protein YcfA (HicA-like mRNA interferase family)
VFPSLKATALLAVLMRKPLDYYVDRQRGSHRTLRSAAGYPVLHFSFHDGTTIPPGVVRKILTRDVGLTEQEALDLL